MSNNYKTQVDNLKEFTLPYYKLKELLRTGWVEKLAIENTESVASHTLLMIVIVMFLANKYTFSCEKKLKLIQMALIHDIAESEVGDITPESMSAIRKKQIENKAFKSILKQLPRTKMRKEISDIWKEYNENKSIDSELIHLIDKLEMLLQSDFYYKHRKNLRRSQIAPFKKSVALFIQENEHIHQKHNYSKIVSSEKNELTEIKEILAYLCK